MEAVVLGAFMTSPDSKPARRRVAPSGDPDKPTVVTLPPWAFRRHSAAGRCCSPAEHEMRRELERETAKQLASLDAAAAEVRARYLASSEVLALEEELSQIGEFSRDALLTFARDHELGVSAVGSETAIRDRVRAALEKRLAALIPEPVDVGDVDEPVVEAIDPPLEALDLEPERVDLDDLRAVDAVALITETEDVDVVMLWHEAEKGRSAPRATVLAALEARFAALDE